MLCINIFVGNAHLSRHWKYLSLFQQEKKPMHIYIINTETWTRVDRLMHLLCCETHVKVVKCDAHWESWILRPGAFRDGGRNYL